VVVEIGVYEGMTSSILERSLAADGELVLVDPYVPALLPERILRVSFPYLIARHSLRNAKHRCRFVREYSPAALETLQLSRPADLVFIDGDHSYPAVRSDFLGAQGILAPCGLIAFHDSRACPARQDLGPTDGPVRLAEEIAAGAFGRWLEVCTADSLRMFQRIPC
jgi:predicted O-methyltransferase YrrM